MIEQQALATQRDQLATPDTSAIERAALLDLITGDQTGYLCIGWIEGNPEVEPMQHALYYVPTQRPKADARLAELAEQGHGIYARMCLFQKLRAEGKRSDIYAVAADYDHALPSRLIWKDDTGIDTPASILIESSPNNYQALIVLDRDASTLERRHLMTTWRASGGDDCSADAVHFIRLPGGRNNKPGKNAHLVRLAVHSTRTYSADKLLARCGPINESTHTPPCYSSDDWRDLPDGAALWQSRRWQALVTRQRPQLKTLLIDRQRLALPNKRTGRTDDDSWSNQRAVFVANVLSAYDPPPLDELRAVAWHFRDYLGERKTDRQYQVDIDDLIAEYTHRFYTSKNREYQPQATKYLQPRPVTAPATAERVARGRAGNHADLVERAYQALVAQSDGAAAIVKLDQLAAELGMHRRTLGSILDELKDAGRIGERKQAGRNSGVYIPIQGVIYSEEQIAELPMAARQTDESTPNAIECTSTRLYQGGVYSQIAQADHTLPVVDQAPAPRTLTEAVEPAAAGSAGYSVDCVQYTDGRAAWRVWDDALDQVIGEYTTEAAALAAVGVEQRMLVVPAQAPTAPQEAEQPYLADFNPAWAAPLTGKPYEGRPKDFRNLEEHEQEANSAIKVRADVADVADLEIEQQQLAGPPVHKPSKSGKVTGLDRYRADVALMSDTQLAGELQKHQRTLKKHAGAVWLRDVRDRLDLVQAELDQRDDAPGPSVRARAGAGPARGSQAQRPQAAPNPFIGQASLFDAPRGVAAD